jgi:hypothetical protein
LSVEKGYVNVVSLLKLKRRLLAGKARASQPWPARN